MRKWILRTLYALPVLLIGGYALSDYTATQGTVAAFVCQATKICPGVVLYDATGSTQQGTSGAPLRIDPTGTTAQPVNATLSAETTKVIGTVNQGTSPWVISGNVANTGTFAVQDATFATVIGAPGATAGSTDTASCSTNQQMQRLAQRLSTMVTALGTPFQAGGSIGNTTFTATQATGSNLHVVCDSGCSGSGGTSSTFGSAFPATGTAIGLTSGTNMVAWSATTNYGTAPAAIAVPAVNAFITNTNANGRAIAALGSPVTPVAAASTAGAIVPNNTTAVVVKGSAGTLFGVQVYGINAAPAYLKIYNAATATCGSGTPVKRIMIPAASTAANGAGSNVTFGPGLALGTGITYCVTTGIADADTTAPTAANFLVNVDYE